MRAPPESLMPMIGMRFFSARSITLMTFSANTSPSEPPNTVASWLNSITSRPPIFAMPVTTPSPAIRFDSSPKPDARWTAKMSSSSNELRSTSRDMRAGTLVVRLRVVDVDQDPVDDVWNLGPPRRLHAFLTVPFRAVVVRRGRRHHDQPRAGLHLTMRQAAIVGRGHSRTLTKTENAR